MLAPMRPPSPAVPVSARLGRSALAQGAVGRRWLAELPAAVERVARAWQLEVGVPLEHSGAAVLLSVRTAAGAPALLKLSLPDEEARHEAEALRRWNGTGAVRVLRASDDGFVLLLERCVPGHDLWSVTRDQQVAVLTGLFPRLWVAPTPDLPVTDLGDTVRRWQREFAAQGRALGLSCEVADRAGAWARELGSDQPSRLLHGDLHPGNVLRAEREPWLAIDPKPWLGDPAFDLAQLLANWLWAAGETGADARSVHRWAAELSERLGLEVRRVLGWAAVKALGWDFDPSTVLVLGAAASSVWDER